MKAELKEIKRRVGHYNGGLISYGELQIEAKKLGYTVFLRRKDWRADYRKINPKTQGA